MVTVTKTIYIVEGLIFFCNDLGVHGRISTSLSTQESQRLLANSGRFKKLHLNVVYVGLVKKIYNPRTQEAESRGLYVKG